MAPAPVIPEAGLSVGLVLLAILCLLLIGLSKGWKFTIGAVLTSLASAVNALPKVKVFGIRVPPWDKLAAAITGLDNFVLNAIGVGIQQSEAGLHAGLGWLTWLLQETASAVAHLAWDTAQALEYLRNVVIPASLKVTVRPIEKTVTHVEKRIVRITTHPVEIVRPVTRILAPGLEALEQKVDALTKKVAAAGAAAVPIALAPPISITIPRAPAIPKDITKGAEGLWKKVRNIGKTLTPAGIAGLVLAATSAVGLTWTRCSNNKRYGERVCGMDQDLLNSLLNDSLLILGTIDLVEFAKGMQTVVKYTAGEAERFWRV